MVTHSPDPEELQRQMRAIRSELGVEVHDLVQNARDLTDWHVYVNRYPWACLAAAAAVGYLIVPHARKTIVPDADSLLELAKHHQLKVEAPGAKKSGGLLSKAAGMAATFALRAAMTALTRKLNPMIDGMMQPSASQPVSPPEGYHDQPN